MGNTSEKVEAFSYLVDQHDSVGDYIHGEFTTVKEFFIPSYNIIFFINKGNLVIISHNKAQSNKELTKILLDKDLIDKLLAIHQLEQQAVVLKDQWLSVYGNKPEFVAKTHNDLELIVEHVNNQTSGVY